MWVKAGQLLSTRGDLFAPNALNILSSLRSNLPPVPFVEILSLVSRELPHAVFLDLEIEPEALGTGCIAQVHLARHRSNGEVLVLKVKKPGVDLALRQDIRIVRAIARVLAKAPAFSAAPVLEVVEQISEALMQQVDFDAEARNAKDLTRIFENDSSVRFPQVILALSSPKILAMRFEESLSPFDTALDDAIDWKEANALAVRALSAIYKMIFRHGCVHCDIHPGNMLVDPQGCIVFLDCGLVIRPDTGRTEDFREFFLSIALAKEEYAARVLLSSSSIVKSGFSRHIFVRDLRALLASVSGKTAEGFSVSDFVFDIYTILRRHGVRSKHDFTWVLLTLLTFEGLIRTRIPSFDFQGLAVTIILGGRIDNSEFAVAPAACSNLIPPSAPLRSCILRRGGIISEA